MNVDPPPFTGQSCTIATNGGWVSTSLRAFALTLAILCVSSPAGATKLVYQLADGWRGQVALSANKALSYCSVSRFVHDGTSLSVAIYPRGDLLLNVHRKDWDPATRSHSRRQTVVSGLTKTVEQRLPVCHRR